jgi:hypothetical protein
MGTILVVASFVLSGCQDKGDTQNAQAGQDTSVVSETVITKAETQDFLHSLPNTLHLARMFKRTGMPYVTGLVHNTKEAQSYVDPTAQAINLGIYSADMGYAVLHNQNQEALKSLKAVKILADALQLNMLYDAGPWLGKFERNLNNSDSVLAIMAQLQMQSDLLLRDNARYDVLYLSFAGAYAESLYLATQLEKNHPNPALIKRISEQQLALGKLILLIEGLDDPDRYMILLTDLKAIQDMMLKLDVGLAEKKPEKARQMALKELYPKVETLRKRLVAQS